MIQLFYTFLEAACAAVVLIPLFLVLNKIRFCSFQNTVLYLLFSIYLSAVYAVVGLPNVTYIRFDLNLNLLPFVSMFSELRATLLNVLLFVPLGFFLYILWKSFRRFARTVLFGFAVSFAIEILQIFTFRATDINDLLTNTLGTLIGWLLAWVARKLFPRLVHNNPSSDLPIIFGCTIGVMFFLQPVIWKIIY